MRYVVALVIALFLYAPAISEAHNLGASYEETVGGVFVDIGYDPEKIFTGSRVLLDFDPLLVGSEERYLFDYAWVRVEQDKKILIATGIARATYGPTTLLFAAPEPADGPLTVHARFEKEGRDSVEVSFPIFFDPKSSSKGGAVSLVWFLAGFALGGVFIGLWGMWKRRDA